MSQEKTKVQELEERLELQSQLIEELRKQVIKEKPNHKKITDYMKMLYDPFDNHNPFKIHGRIPADEAYPKGQVLRWLNPRSRDLQGWDGYEVIHWGDQYAGENGENLKECMAAVPYRMQGPDKLDSVVRRGDMVLGRIDARIWESRQLKRTLINAQRVGELSSGAEQVIRKGLKIIGKGMEQDLKPFEKKSENYLADVMRDTVPAKIEEEGNNA